MALLQIGKERRLARVPAQLLLRECTGGRTVNTEESTNPAKMVGSLFCWFTHDRQVQVLTDNTCDVADGDTFISNPVKFGSCRSLFQSQPEKLNRIEPVHGTPAVTPFANVGRHAFLPRDTNKGWHEATITLAVHRVEPDNRLKELFDWVTSIHRVGSATNGTRHPDDPATPSFRSPQPGAV